MNCSIILEHRFISSPNGHIWDETAYPYEFWQRYLTVFDSVNVVARVIESGNIGKGYRRVDGPSVSVSKIPYYLGPMQYVIRWSRVRNALVKSIANQDAIIFRIPSTLAATFCFGIQRSPRPFGVEVVGDPFDVFAPNVLRHPIRPLLRWFFKRQVSRLCHGADAVAYVNEFTLKKRYPANAGAYVTAFSSVELPEEAFCPPNPKISNADKTRIIFIGSLAQNYKGADILLNAAAILKQSGLNMEFHIIGDGRFRPQLEQQATQLSLNRNVAFLGQLPAGKAIRQEIDTGHIFVLPARTEGLPRVIIEAMARAKPCIGTRVGGIPELLHPDDLISPDDPYALASKIVQFTCNPDRMTVAAERNYAKARQYHKTHLDKRRQAFYTNLRSKTELWFNRS